MVKSLEPYISTDLINIPFTGPLVYSIFVCPKSREHYLKANGANDSKALTSESREKFFHFLLSGKVPANDKEEREPDSDAFDFGWRARILHPEFISNCMLKKDKFNLNELSYETVFCLIESLLKENIRIEAAFVDTLGKAEKYQASLTAKFPGIKFTVRSKADSLFPVVGAASIVAKVIRDDVLGRVCAIPASGYPGDAATVTWLQNNVDTVFGFPNLVRFSWSSCNDLLEKRCCRVTWNDDDDRSNKGNFDGESETALAPPSWKRKAFNNEVASNLGPRNGLFGFVSCAI